MKQDLWKTINFILISSFMGIMYNSLFGAHSLEFARLYYLALAVTVVLVGIVYSLVFSLVLIKEEGGFLKLGGYLFIALMIATASEIGWEIISKMFTAILI